MKNLVEEPLANRLFHGMCLFVLFVVASAASFSSFIKSGTFASPESAVTMPSPISMR